MTSEQTRRGPARFQQDDPVDRRRTVLQALGAGLALLVLTVGVPGVLIWQGGLSALPTSLPSRDDLTAEIGADQLVTILVVVALLAWLQFTICVVVELRSALSGFGMPPSVPMSAPMQRFARVLVGSVLVASTAVGPAAAATGDADAGRAAPPVPEHAVAQVVEPGAEMPTGQDRADRPLLAPSGEDGEVVYYFGDEVLDEEDAEQLVGHNVYRVQPPEGRYHDNLWDIAERHLGDGRRYKEIFELNRGRIQPDGHELSLARLIYPEWLLIMPDDATGLDRVSAETVERPAPADAGQAGTPADGPASAQFVPEPQQAQPEVASDTANGGAVAGVAEYPAPGEQDVADDSGTRSQGWSELLTAGLLCAGLLAAIETVRRRRRTPEPEPDEVETEVALRIAADPDRASRLDVALRSLPASGHRPPSVYSVVVDEDGIELKLAPAMPEAPEPWEAHDDGQRWWLPAGAESAASGQDAAHDAAGAGGGQGGAAPYPGLVSLGRDGDGRDVLIDLEAASGPVAVTGDPTVAFEVVTAMAVELATNTWSDRMRVTGVDLPPVLAELGPERYESMDVVTDALARLAAKQTGTHGTDVLTGRVRWPGNDQFVPEYVVLGAVPDENVAGRLRELTAGSRAPVGVLSAGEFPGARWRLEVDSAGTLHVPALGVSVAANRMAMRTAALTAALVSPAPAEPADPFDGRPLPEAWLTELRPEIPPPAVELDTAALATAPVRVFILGAPEVQAVGPIAEERRELATELVVFLTMHRDGVHPNVLSAALWPGGVTADVRDSTIERVREWLGTNPEGSPYLLATPDGRLMLSDDVALDWDAVTTLLRRSREAASPSEEADLLRRALRVARGPAIDRRPRGRYSWIARVRLENTVSDALVDAAHRLSVLTTDRGDPGTGAAAARAGIRVRPGEQVLWRDLLRAEHARVGHEGVVATTESLVDELGALGVPELEPATVALLDELDPGRNLGAAVEQQAG